uniref:RNA helicase n=1 Tax=Panagrolaimus sp. ES5 TaxID=591445 RepID=A0AC34FG72_9BILA
MCSIFQKNIDEIGKGCDFLIATPGQLIHFIKEGIVYIDTISYLVLDECDELLKTSPNPNTDSLSKQVERIWNWANRNAQMICVSATMGEFTAAFCQTLVKPENFFYLTTPVAAPNKRVQLIFQLCTNKTKRLKVMEYLAAKFEGCQNPFQQQAFLFAKDCGVVADLSLALDESDIPTAPLHGNVGQDVREKSLNLFRRRQIAVLSVSDVGSRGMDITNVETVVNYEMPQQINLFIHRVGRCGRNKPGTAVTFVTASDKEILVELRKVIEDAGHEIPPTLDELLCSL